MRKFVAGLVAALAVFGASAAPAQEAYPTRPVKIIIAFPVGGLLDTISRVVGEKLLRSAELASGEDLPLVWSDENDYQVAYDATGATRAEAFAAWETEVEHSRRIEREAQSLDIVRYNPRWGEDVSLRMVMMHMVHEYARHSGHADLLREGIDGTTGV